MSQANSLSSAWLRRRTSRWQDWPVRQLATRKAALGVTVSVVIPARDEGETQLSGETQQPAAQRGQSPRQHGVELRQFVRADGEMRQRSRPVPVDERPAARSVRIAPL